MDDKVKDNLGECAGTVNQNTLQEVLNYSRQTMQTRLENPSHFFRASAKCGAVKWVTLLGRRSLATEKRIS